MVGCREWMARGLAAAAALAVCGLLTSCVSLQFSSPSDYVGPAKTPLPPLPGATLPAEPVKVEPGKTEPGKTTPGTPETCPILFEEPKGEPIIVSVTQAIMVSLGNNQALVVEKFNPEIFRTFEQQQRAVFDPNLRAGASANRRLSQANGVPGTSLSKLNSAEVGATEFLPTGTTIDVAGTTDGTPGPFGGDDFFASRVGMTVTQALLRGFGMDVNLANLRQARIDTLSSQYELRGFAESLVAQTEEAYWNYALAQRQIEIVNESLALAEQQLKETDERIRVGKLAEIERVTAEAEVATRRENLINARSTMLKARLTLLRLLNPTKTEFWTRDVVIETPPGIPDVQLEDIAAHAALAQRMRPDLNQARLQVQRGDLEIVKTKNGLLPKMDLFMTLGKTGYADTFRESWRQLDDKGYDLLVGVNIEYPLLNRSAQALNQRARLSRDQAIESVGNLAQLVELDVRTAYIEVTRAREQVAATAVTKRLQEEKVRAEMEKFRVGKSTSLLVAQAQRDLLQSQISQVQAVVGYLNALVEFYRLEGSLLERRGVACPGREPVEMPKEKKKL